VNCLPVDVVRLRSGSPVEDGNPSARGAATVHITGNVTVGKGGRSRIG
jgi:hypothetical protein